MPTIFEKNQSAVFHFYEWINEVYRNYLIIFSPNAASGPLSFHFLPFFFDNSFSSLRNELCCLNYFVLVVNEGPMYGIGKIGIKKSVTKFVSTHQGTGLAFIYIEGYCGSIS